MAEENRAQRGQRRCKDESTLLVAEERARMPNSPARAEPDDEQDGTAPDPTRALPAVNERQDDEEQLGISHAKSSGLMQAGFWLSRPATGGEAPSSKTQAPGKLQTSSSNPVGFGGLLMAHTRLVAAAEQLAENLLDACRQGGKSDYDELPTFLEKDRQPGKKTQFGGGHRATAQD